MSAAVLVRREGAVLRLTLNRPERSNALGPDIVEALLAAVSDPGEARLIVFEGAGRHFCAGFDLGDLSDLSDGDLLLRVVRIETLLQAVHHAPVPTVALVRGAAMGAGADLVVACRYRLVIGTARFAFPGAGFGLALGTRRLAGRVGGDVALDLVASGTTVDQDVAVSLGLIDRTIEAEEIGGEIDRLTAMARRLGADTLADISGLTVAEGRDRDMAALVASASRPGLKQRIAEYMETVHRERDARRNRQQGDSA